MPVRIKISSPTDIAADAACVTGEMVGANELVNGVVQSAGATDLLKWLVSVTRTIGLVMTLVVSQSYSHNANFP